MAVFIVPYCVPLVLYAKVCFAQPVIESSRSMIVYFKVLELHALVNYTWTSLTDIDKYRSVLLILPHTGQFECCYYIRVNLIEIATYGSD